MAQPQLIDSVIAYLHLQHNTKMCNAPALLTAILHKDHYAPEMKPEFDYWSTIGKLNFLEKSTQVDLCYIAYIDVPASQKPPKISHAKAVKHIGKYLLSTHDQGLIMCPDHTHGFRCWVDSDFTGNWKHHHWTQ